MRRLVWVLAVLSVPGLVTATEIATTVDLLCTDCSGGGGGDAETSAQVTFPQEANETNLSDGHEVMDTAWTLRNWTDENLSAAQRSLETAGNLSQLVEASTKISLGAQTDGKRTNLSTARGLNGLTQSIVDLHEEFGDPLSLSEQVNVSEQAENVPANLSEAVALVNYATIDALHYSQQALDDVNQTERRIVRENASQLGLWHRSLDFSAEDGEPTLNLTDDQASLRRAAMNVTRDINTAQLFKASDVLAEAVDETTEDLNTSDKATSTEAWDGTCAQGEVVLESPNCRIVMGSFGDNEYDPDSFESGGQSQNVVLVDPGGQDIFHHRAGGAGPRQSQRVQVNLNLEGPGGPDRDVYNATGNNFGGYAVEEGPAQGSGRLAVGVLYDQSGDDLYKAEPFGKQSNISVQASGLSGVGLLFDQAGEDRYEMMKEETPNQDIHAQGYGQVGGFGLLADLSGNDFYHRHTEAKSRDVPKASGARRLRSPGSDF